jgi:FKBP-type peptidyl-prolyl cis-trans isomerase 2
MTIKEKNFVEIDYTGKLKQENIIFDTTIKTIAEENGIGNKDSIFEPIIICVGQNQIIKGIDNNLIGKKVGDELNLDISPEEGYGKKNPKLIQLIATPKFKKQGINPVPGLQVQLDNKVGVIRAVNGGRTLVDMNHPLSGKELVYNVKINRLIDKNEEKISSILKTYLNITNISIDIKDDKATIALKQEVPEVFDSFIKEKIKELINLKEIDIVRTQKNKKAEINNIDKEKKEE